MNADVLITGGSGGVAQAVAHVLLDAGCRIALVSRTPEKIVVADALKIAADVSTEAGAQAAIAQAVSHFGRAPTCLVHAAGSTLIAPIGRTREEQYRAVLAANLDSAFFTSKAWLDALGKAPGSAVLFSSVVARVGVANHAAIAAAKAGVEALTRSLAADHAAQGVRINCLAPGLMRSPMTERMLGNDKAVAQISAQYPLGRHGDAHDAANAARFLLSDEAGWITGQVLGLDGGFTAVRPLVRPA
jgi:NAD(P)-dependent dehydrogenase (short-subunit alcohol dehydrogenase family)